MCRLLALSQSLSRLSTDQLPSLGTPVTLIGGQRSHRWSFSILGPVHGDSGQVDTTCLPYCRRVAKNSLKIKGVKSVSG